MQPRIYQYEMLRSVVMGVYEAYDTASNRSVTIYEWTPAPEERGAAKMRLSEILSAINGGIEGEVFTSDASLYLSAPTPEAAASALEKLRSRGLFTSGLAAQPARPPAAIETPAKESGRAASSREESGQPPEPPSRLRAATSADQPEQSTGTVAATGGGAARPKIEYGRGASPGKSHLLKAMFYGLCVCAVFSLVFGLLLGYSDQKFGARASLPLSLAYLPIASLIGMTVRRAAGGSRDFRYRLISGILAYFCGAIACFLLFDREVFFYLFSRPYLAFYQVRYEMEYLLDHPLRLLASPLFAGQWVSVALLLLGLGIYLAVRQTRKPAEA